MQLESILLIIVLATIALAVAIFNYYERIKNKEKVSYLLAFFRFITFLMLILLFVNPKMEYKSVTTVKPKLSVLLDNSNSIKYLEAETLLDSVYNKFKSAQALNQKFDVAYYNFSESISVVDTSINTNKDQSDIYNALEVVEQLDPRSTIVLVSDGNQTKGKSYNYYQSKNETAIHSLVLGDTTQYSDLKIDRININKYSFLNNKFPVEIFIQGFGLKQNTEQLFKITRGNRILYSEKINIEKGNSSLHFDLLLPAERLGVNRFQASISSLSNEKNIRNNSFDFSINIIDERSKTVIITNVTHPDIGTLKRAITSNQQREVVIKSPNEIESLNDFQSIIVYQPDITFSNVYKQLSLQNRNYFLITGLQTDWSFLNSSQSVFKKRVTKSQENYFGLLNSAFTTFNLPNLNFEQFPPLMDYFGEIKLKKDTDILMYQRIRGIETDYPLMAIYEKANHKVVGLFGQGLWRWRMSSYTDSQKFIAFDNFILGIIQFITAQDRVDRLEVKLPETIYANELLQIQASYLNKGYQQDSGAILKLQLKNNDEVKQYVFDFGLDTYQLEIEDLKPGLYEYSVTVDKERELKTNGSFQVLDYSIEQAYENADFNAMNLLSTTNNGKAYAAEEATKLIEFLEGNKDYKQIEKVSVKDQSLIDIRLLLGLLVLSLSLEWFIRKYNGLT